MTRTRFDMSKTSKLSIVAALFALVVWMGVGYKLAGRSDRGKSYDLYTIRAAVMDFYYDHDKLPETLGQLGHMSLRGRVQNYELNLEYKEYLVADARGVYVKNRQTDAFNYTLCTRFALPGPALAPYGFVDFTSHKIGRQCYKMDVYQQGITSAKYSQGDYPKELGAYFGN